MDCRRSPGRDPLAIRRFFPVSQHTNILKSALAQVIRHSELRPKSL